jgi:NAD(P)-dependent dehydrogenase (short-subunit alcohol dehydrogenase family)
MSGVAHARLRGTRRDCARCPGRSRAARVDVFPCSPAARFMTGTIVPVDGGYLIA